MPPMITHTAIAIAIAIDGPVASGKSAVGRLVAGRLGYRFIDTGVMYRALTWLALERGVECNDEAALTQLATAAQLQLADGEDGVIRVLLDCIDVTEQLRSPDVGESVSLVSRVAGVRQAMVELQRKIAAEADTVMVGRDIGTVVLTDAKLKVYLDATAEERVRRRYRELLAVGKAASEDEVREELALRDTIDSGRDASPLRPAEDAIIIHTDDLSLEGVVDKVLELVQCR